jgi:hypothetical protein
MRPDDRQDPRDEPRDEPPGANRRHRILVNRDLQYKIVLSASLPVLVILLFVICMQLIFDHGVRTGTIEVGGTILGLPERIFAVVLFFFFSVLLFVTYALKVSHRIAGAAYRLSRTMREFQEGDRDVRARLRYGDLHTALAHDLNAFLDWVQSELPATEEGHPERSGTAGRDPFERSGKNRRVLSPR